MSAERASLVTARGPRAVERAREQVAALLDETGGRTILMDGGFEDLMVTAKLEVVYRRPTPTGVPPPLSTY